jgi:hypothetical protein
MWEGVNCSDTPPCCGTVRGSRLQACKLLLCLEVMTQFKCAILNSLPLWILFFLYYTFLALLPPYTTLTRTCRTVVWPCGFGIGSCLLYLCPLPARTPSLSKDLAPTRFKLCL